MPWQIIISSPADIELSAIPRPDRRTIADAIGRLTTDFGSSDVSKLAGKTGERRLRVGRWRIRLHLDNRAGTIIITRVLPRGRSYRR